MNRSGVYVIAEAGVNHNGSLDLALKMIDSARSSGADAIKFQTFRADKLVTKNARKADYQAVSKDSEESQYNMIKKLELDLEAHKRLILACNENRIDFLSSPFDLESIDLLNELGLTTFKIPSGEITNLPYLRKIAGLGKEVILSTGMSYMNEVGFAIKTLIENGTNPNNLVVLHCNSEYPTPFEDVNLKAMLTIRDAFEVRIGYSDHTNGIEVPVAAVALGATVIEKHFTLNKNMEGPDHKASLDPEELRRMVTAIRNIEKSLGNGIKIPSNSEMKNLSVVRKSIVAVRLIKKGEKFTDENLTVKRPGTGISPVEWDNVIGKVAQKDFEADEAISI